MSCCVCPDEKENFSEDDAENIMQKFDPVLVSNAKPDGTTVQKVVGNVVLIPSLTPGFLSMVSPMTQKPCAFYWVSVQARHIIQVRDPNLTRFFMGEEGCGDSYTEWEDLVYEERCQDFVLHDGNTSIFIPASDNVRKNKGGDGDMVMRIANDDGTVGEVISGGRSSCDGTKEFLEARGIQYNVTSSLPWYKKRQLRIREGCFDSGETIAALGFVKRRRASSSTDTFGAATLELVRLKKESLWSTCFENEEEENKWKELFEPIVKDGQPVDNVKTVALLTDDTDAIGLSLEQMENLLPEVLRSPPVHVMGRQGATVVAPTRQVRME